MLIKCPQCGKEASTRARVCIDCGCAIEFDEDNPYICVMNGVPTDLKSFLDLVERVDYEEICLFELYTHYDMNVRDCRKLYHMIHKTGIIPYEFNYPLKSAGKESYHTER